MLFLDTLNISILSRVIFNIDICSKISKLFCKNSFILIILSGQFGLISEKFAVVLD